MQPTPVKTHPQVEVLLIDDQQEMVDRLRLMLAGFMDITLHYCADPHQAVRQVRELSPSVILLDILMGNISGLALIRDIRATPWGAYVPIIMLTVAMEAETKSQAFASGANDYIVKLPDPVELAARLRFHSQSYHSARLAEEQARDLRQKEQRLRSLVDHALDAILTLDVQGRVSGFNHAALTLFGIDADTMTNLPAANLFRWEGPPPWEQGDILPHSMRLTTMATHGRRTTPFPVEVAISVNPWDEASSITLHIRDITLQLATEEQLRAMARSLESEVAHRHAELESANLSLKREVQERTRSEMQERRGRQVQRAISRLLQIGMGDDPLESKLAASLSVLHEYSGLEGAVEWMLQVDVTGDGCMRQVLQRRDDADPVPSQVAMMAMDSLESVPEAPLWVDADTPCRFHGCMMLGNVHHVHLPLHSASGQPMGMLTAALLPGSRQTQELMTMLGDIANAMGMTLVSERANRLHLEKTRAQAASDAKSLFLATMSHEIRTPMNNIMGLTEILREMEFSVDKRGYLDTLHRSGATLLNLIDDVLDLSKVESGQMTLENLPFDPRELTLTTVELFQMRAQRKGLSLECHLAADLPGMILGDPVRVRQVLINLVGNAIKFTQQGQVTVRVDLTDAREVCWSVADTGIGIPPHKLSSIFQPFSQADESITRRYGGSGLGLAISFQLVQRMGGRLSLESREGEGSRFSLMLPLHEAHADQTAVHLETASLRERFDWMGQDRRQIQDRRNQERRNGDRRRSNRRAARQADILELEQMSLRILLVDDTVDNRQLVRAFLKRTAWQIQEAEDGAQAVAMAAPGGFDLILMDVQMPVMDGYTATRTIREHERCSGRDPVFIIALTAHAMHGEERKALEAGCNIHLAKPVSKAVLLERIRALARQLRAREEVGETSTQKGMVH
ncbi:MAG: response regulator [Magnetococcus sp. WYHC-3]